MVESAVARHDRWCARRCCRRSVRSTADVPPDFWQSLARNFRAPADPTADPTPDALAALIGPEDDVLDIGAGGGRIAIPLSRRCRQLVAVEPSPAMRAVLEDEIAQHGVRNIRIVPARWEDAGVEPAALAFAARGLRDLSPIGPFLESREKDRGGWRPW